MLVQVSSWKTTKTSIRASKNARRRKRDETREFPAVISFVTTSSKKGLQKLKQHSSEFSDSMPLIAVTSDHQITVIGQSKDASYDEYTSLKYASRPGSAGSFFATPQNGRKKASSAPQIPAILDAKNDRVYAFQHGNTRLCCWNSLSANGPDEKGSLKVELTHPALSLSLLPMHKGIVYGTCQNGTIFVARVVEDSENKETIDVEYLPTSQEKGSLHVGTVAELPTNDQKKTSGQKRKVSDADGRSTVIFYQVYRTDNTVKLISQKVACERFSKEGRLVIEESLSKQVATIDLVATTGWPKGNLDRISLLISSSGSSPKAALFYTISNSGTNGSTETNTTRSYCALLSLCSGDISTCPVPLPSGTKQCDLVTETLVAVGTKDAVFLFDLETGSILHSRDVGSLLGDSGDNWILSTNSKFSAIAILYLNDGIVNAAFSILSLQDRKKLPSTGLSLASKLASSMTLPPSSHELDTENTPVVVNDLSRINNDKSSSSTKLEEAVQKALTTLDEARSKILSDKNNSSDDLLFLDTYDDCVSGLVEDLKLLVPPQHPLDSIAANGKRLNGVKQNGSFSSKKVLTGVISYPAKPLQAFTPSSLPPGFIDGALRIVLSLLQCGKTENSRRVGLARLDARFILNRLIATGKVSARLHFEDSNSFLESNGEQILETVLRSIKLSNKRGKRVYSPVDLILGMLRYCPDLSERQLVVMLNYALRRSLPDDIAEALMEAHLSIHHPYKTLARRYFSLRNQHLKRSIQEKDSKMPKEVESLSRKLIITGVSYILQQIICYADCNEATLRASLAEGITNSQEAIILAKLLANVLETTPKSVALGNLSSRHNHVKTTCQWISALCESFQDDLSEAKTAEGQDYLSFLLQSVSRATKHSQAIISLREAFSQNALHDDLVPAKKQKTDTKSVHEQRKSSFLGDEEIPGYSIDRMVF